MRCGIIAALLVLIVSACGGRAAGKIAVAKPAMAQVDRHCEPRGADVNGYMHQLEAGFRLCLNIARSGHQHSTIERRVGGSWRVLSGPPLGNVADARDGEWLNADLSPDGRTILAQWGGPCEVPNAFFLPASGGRLRPVTGEQQWTKAPMSAGVGWREDGRAVVRVLSGGCGPDFRRPGLYLIDPKSGRGQFVRPLNRREGG